MVIAHEPVCEWQAGACIEMREHGTQQSFPSCAVLRAARKIVLNGDDAGAVAVKTNITLKIEADVLRQARVLAAEEGTSISALVANQLEQILRERKGYSQARRRALIRLRKGLDLGWTPPLSRDELHER